MLWIRGARLFLPGGKWAYGDIAIEGGHIRRVVPAQDGENGKLSLPGRTALDQTIDARGRTLVPGFVDMHVHLREPGGTYKETIEAGTLAAARGGFTAVAMMPNTSPVLDQPGIVRTLMDRAEQVARVRTYVVAAMTRGLEGQELTDMTALHDLGVVGFTDDGRGVQRSDVMLAAMRTARALGSIIMTHNEEEALSAGGVIRKGTVQEALGIKGMEEMFEALPLSRDVLLAKMSGVRYHALHLSTRASLSVLAFGRSLGVDLSAEVTPHHLVLSEEDLLAVDKEKLPNWKMNPPLAPESERRALVDALRSGLIDMIATDHAPHSEAEKRQGLSRAPFGIVGLETAFPLLYTKLVLPGHVPLDTVLWALAVFPRRRFHLPGGVLAEGAVADLTLIDPQLKQTVHPETFASLGRNTPFAGWELQGYPVLTIVRGNIVYRHSSLS
ncbi:MAG: dihydroorotase [Candidatus Carbobacillus altaicus]|nr:dihydroorotase [Candidatus Carbobacillus altaicus]